MSRLLTLSPERIARELRHAAWAEAEEREARRKARIAAGIAAAWLAAAYALMMVSFWVSDPQVGNVAFWAALAAGNFGPVLTGLTYWKQSET